MSNYHGAHSLSFLQLEITVADLAASVAFYRDALGFSVDRRGPGHAEVSADGTTVLLTLRERPGLKPRGRTAGLYHVAFLLPSRDALGGFLRRAIATQLPIKGAADHRVSEAIYLRDPDGNGIEVYADADEAGWRNGEGSLAMGTDPFDYAGVYYAAQTTPDVMPADTVIGHVHLAVKDLGASLRFYRDVIGFAVTSDTYPEAFFLASLGYHHHVAINAWEHAAARNASRAGIIGATLAFPDCEAAKAAFERAKPAGSTVREDGSILSAADPDGTVIMFTVV